LFFDNISDTTVFAKLRKAVSLESVASGGAENLIYDAASDMISEAERKSLRGDLWEIFFALAVVTDENSTWRACETSPMKDGLFGVIANEVWSRHKIITAVKRLVERDDNYAGLRPLSNYIPGTETQRPHAAEDTFDALLRLASVLASAYGPDDMRPALMEFRSVYGGGRFALGCAFKWDSGSGRLVPIEDIDPTTLDSLAGYDSQKRELTANTESFIRGKPSNNVLLFGDSGTGKSSSVRALLNERDFVKRRLRIIEVKQGQFSDIPDILGLVRGEPYRFILFMDDLSFEEFEVEYKHLKALIEGGLERKPDNVLIYATSNRRNIIREVWSDRAASTDDVHGVDTMQERHSLSDRFGLTIWYPSAGKDGYISMVRAIAAELRLKLPDAGVEEPALRWELEHGGFTGRTARQFVYHLLQEEA
jgi:predicted AAA+ superfamily ATPase